MADYSKIPFSNIRSYLWTQLKESSVLSEDDYWVEKMKTKLNPIIPSQQIPEFQNLLPGKPYIIYDIETLQYDSEFWICEEVATLTVVGNSYQKLYEIIELIKDTMRRYDISAAEINSINISSKFKFLKTYVSGIISPNIGSEGDVQTATIEITYCYTRDLGAGYRYS